MLKRIIHALMAFVFLGSSAYAAGSQTFEKSY